MDFYVHFQDWDFLQIEICIFGRNELHFSGRGKNEPIFSGCDFHLKNRDFFYIKYCIQTCRRRMPSNSPPSRIGESKAVCPPSRPTAAPPPHPAPGQAALGGKNETHINYTCHHHQPLWPENETEFFDVTLVHAGSVFRLCDDFQDTNCISSWLKWDAQIKDTCQSRDVS